MTAVVHLGPTRVGFLERDASDRVTFRFDVAYLARPDRPVLGRHFEELELSPDREHVGPRGSLHPFFRNALPEGALRKWLEEQLGHGNASEYGMLVRLGEDLPGALRVVAPSGFQLDADPAFMTRHIAPGSGMRFSLAGVHLKASVAAEGDRVTLPVVGEAGDWIAKFPSARFEALPENEFAMLRWARRAGLVVPEHRLYPVDQIENLPTGFPRVGRALLVRRFDRADGGRVHQEDFAQVFNLAPEMKYVGDLPDHVHCGAIAAVVRRHCGEADLDEVIRRLVFNVLCGNADAHCKNWALVYADGRHARLSPLYDVVATVAYEGLGTELPILWLPADDPWHAPPVALTAITPDSIRDLARFVGRDPEATLASVLAFARGARLAWTEVVAEGELPPLVIDAVASHLATVAL